jgi:HK97 family phage major capsid protein
MTKEQLEGKSAEELAGIFMKESSIKLEAIEKLAKESADDNAKEILELKSELSKDRAEQIKAMNAQLNHQDVQIKKLSQRESETKMAQLSSIRTALESKREELKGIKGNKSASLEFKVAGTMLESTNITGDVPQAQRLAGFDILPSRRIRLMDVVSRGSAESNVIDWVSQANKDGAAGQTGEGALKNQIDFDLVVNSESLKKTTAYIKISEEMLTDVAFIEAEINNELMREILKAVEAQVFEGDGTGNNLNGIKTIASAFAAGSFAATVDNANDADVLTVAANQIEVAEQDAANFAFVHPNTITALKLIKTSTTDRRYIDRLAMVAGQMSLDGIGLIATTLVTDGEYLIGHFPNATVYDKGSVNFKTGYENDDFTKNLVTILAEWRGLVVVKTNRRSSFVTGVFATDKAALETA